MNSACPRIRVQEVAAILGCAKSTVWAWVKAGYLPEPCRVGKRFSYWLKDEIFEIARQRAKRGNYD